MKYLYILLLFISFDTHATKWGDAEVDDPINLDVKCKVKQPASWGSYVYNWPSKYDQVFWPSTTSQGIWYCEGSGFIAFISDFEDITEEEKAKINNYLADKKDIRLNSLSQKIERLESIYALRNKDAEFNNRMLRTFAYLYEQSGELDLANSYRKKALSQINDSLKKELPEPQRLEYLFIAANYERQFGNVDLSNKKLSELEKAIENIQDEQLEGFGGYLSELTQETLKIKEGGKLAPDET